MNALSEQPTDSGGKPWGQERIPEGGGEEQLRDESGRGQVYQANKREGTPGREQQGQRKVEFQESQVLDNPRFNIHTFGSSLAYANL